MEINNLEKFISKMWRIEPVLNIKYLSTNGYNSNIQIETSNNKYILQSVLDKEELIREIYFNKIFSYNNIPVNKLLPVIEDKLIVCHYGRSWLLKQYLEGTTFEMNSIIEMEEAANMLVKIHKIKIGAENYRYSSIHDPYHWLLDPQKEIKAIEELFPNIDFLFFKNIINKISDRLTLEKYIQLPCSIVHGDYHGKNLIYENKTISGILDFETIGISARIIDILEAIFFMGRLDHKVYIYNEEMIAHFLDIYLKEFDLTQNELEFAEDILKLRFIPRSVYLKKISYYKNQMAIDQLKWARKAICSMDKFFKNSIMRKIGFTNIN